MKPRLVAIFAHPDDEAFGPSGTLALMSKTHDVYILCATRGEAGQNHQKETQEETIGDIREKELRASAELIGAKEVLMLGFEDGSLCNNSYHAIADKVLKHLDEIKPEILMTFELRGISGHIDHVTISMVTSFLFNKTSYTKELMYHCMSEKERENMSDYFIFVPPGYKKSEVDKVIDISEVWNTKVEAIKKHASQAKDGSRMLAILEQIPREEYFLIKKK